MLIKNQEKIGVITAIGSNGEGIVKEEGFVIFLPFAFLNEKIRYKILSVKKNFAYAKVIEVLTASPARVTPKCPIFFKCGGCQLQHINYSAQLDVKRNIVRDCFSKIAAIDVSVAETEKSDKEWGYRNKLQLPVAEVFGKTVIGFYAENSHRVVQVEDCPITDWSKDIIAAFSEYISAQNIKGYNEETGKGELRHIVCRGIENKFIITAVATSENLRGVDFLIEKLKEHFENFSLYVNVNNQNTNVIFGDKFILKYGEPKYLGETFGIKYEFGVESFLQVNKGVAEAIYSKALELAEVDDKTTVIDAYSGAGLMTAMFARKAKKAIGVEIIAEAVACANNLARLNGLEEKMENICGKCEEILPPLIKRLQGQGEKVTLILDPPRKGCEESVIKAIIESCAERIIYISCNPATLSRDIGLITGSLRYTARGIEKTNNAMFSPTALAEACSAVDTALTTSNLQPTTHGEKVNNTMFSPTALAVDTALTTSNFQHLAHGEKTNNALEQIPAIDNITRVSLSENRYNITAIKPYDMFPQTKHIETLVCIVRK